MNWMLIALVAYLLAMVAIGVWVAPRIRTEDDFLLAGRRLGYPLTILAPHLAAAQVEARILARA